MKFTVENGSGTRPWWVKNPAGKIVHMDVDRGRAENIAEQAELLSQGGSERPTTPPPQPYHRWRMNEDPDFPHLMGDYCLDCGVKRFPHDDQPVQRAKAQASCPGKGD